jgi:hypothetical protein
MSYYSGAGRGGESLYRFEDCMLDTGRRELRRERGLVPIEPRVSDPLECLIRNRDHMVSKDDLPTGPCSANPPCRYRVPPIARQTGAFLQPQRLQGEPGRTDE